MEIVHITTHSDDAVARLPEQYKDLPKITALAAMSGARMQVLEDIFYRMISNLSILNGVGIELDQIGELVEQDREGLSDPDYRVRLISKVYQNVSRGTGEELIRLFKTLMQASLVYLSPVFPASMSLTAIGFTPVGSTAEIYAAINAALSGGVSIDHFATAPAIGSFSFSDDPDPNGLGFGDANDVTVGGTLASIF